MSTSVRAQYAGQVESGTMDLRHELERSFRQHERLLWGLAYRMTGTGADADEIVQETFVRALTRPPADTTAPLRPWLVRVATNLALDALRRRQRRPYVGPWLPEPIEAGPELDDVPGARYERLESVGFAFMTALEALAPKQRAVLLLRDVLDYSVRETAVALELSEGNVKVIHHRARRAMATYDAVRVVPDAAVRRRTREALERFLSALLAGDAAALEAVLSEDVRAMNDAAGEFHAARKPLDGRDRVARFHLRILRHYDLSDAAAQPPDIRLVNGLPALVAAFRSSLPGTPPRQVVAVETDGDGHIRRILAVSATAKVRRLFGTA